MPALDRYNNNLATPQAPGTGCHGWIMSTANLGIIAKLSGEQIFSGIRQSIPQGSRRIPDKEINDAIHKAKQDFDGGTFTPRPRPAPVVKDGKAARQKIINQATIKTEADLWESSPIRLHNEPAKDSPLLLKTLHDEDAFIWTGDRHEPGTAKNILPVCELIENYNAGKQPSTFIIPNRLSGLPAPKKNGEGITLSRRF
jgi:hypothetical protein